MTHDDYRAALRKISSAPLTLNEYDFLALEAFNPADEIRGRAAMRRAQLARVAVHTKTEPRGPALVADAIETALKTALAPVVERLRAVETAAADVGPVRDRVAALERRTTPTVSRLSDDLLSLSDDLTAKFLRDVDGADP